MINTYHEKRMTPINRRRRNILNRIMILRIKNISVNNFNREDYLYTIKAANEYRKKNMEKLRIFVLNKYL